MMVAKYSAMQRYRKSGSARRSSFGRVNRENPNSNSPKSSTKNLEKQPNTENEKRSKSVQEENEERKQTYEICGKKYAATYIKQHKKTQHLSATTIPRISRKRTVQLRR